MCEARISSLLSGPADAGSIIEVRAETHLLSSCFMVLLLITSILILAVGLSDGYLKLEDGRWLHATVVSSHVRLHKPQLTLPFDCSDSCWTARATRSQHHFKALARLHVFVWMCRSCCVFAPDVIFVPSRV